MKLLSTNAKLEKSDGPAAVYLVAGLTLAPHGLSGNQVCPGSSVGCRAACNLWFAGRRVTDVARNRAIRDTQRLFSDREGFLTDLHKDIRRHVQRAEKLDLRPLVRLNVVSDLDWTDVIRRHSDVTFYDYTKVRSRFDAYLRGELPANYYLTFSASEQSDPAAMAGFLDRGGNVAVVFDVEYVPQRQRFGKLPAMARFAGRDYLVIDADPHDIRLPEVDGRGVVCGLRLKGTNAARARARKTGFAR